MSKPYFLYCGKIIYCYSRSYNTVNVFNMLIKIQTIEQVNMPIVFIEEMLKWLLVRKIIRHLTTINQQTNILNADFNEAFLNVCVWLFTVLSVSVQTCACLLCCLCLFLSSMLSSLPFVFCVGSFFYGWQILILKHNCCPEVCFKQYIGG